MSYRRLEEHNGLQWPCPDESHPGSPFLHGRLWDDPPGEPLAIFVAAEHDPPVDKLSEDFPIRLTTGRLAIACAGVTQVQARPRNSPA